MRRFYKIFRAIAVTLLSIAIVLPLVVYILLSLSGVQEKIKDRAEIELSQLLDAPVRIGSLSIQLPSRLVIDDITVKDKNEVNALEISRVDAAIEMRAFIETGRIIITYAEIDNLRASLYREKHGAPLNIDHIIKALQPKDRNKPPTVFDLRVGHLLLRNSSVYYDVMSAPLPVEGHFDPNHVAVTDINVNLLLPRLRNDDFTVRMRRLSCRERSGLRLSNLQFDTQITNRSIQVSGLSVRTPRSAILIGDIQLDFNGWGDIPRAIRDDNHELRILEGTVITPSEFVPFMAGLSKFDDEVHISADATGCLNNTIEIQDLKLSVPGKSLLFNSDAIVLSGLGSEKQRELGVKASGLHLAFDARQTASVVSEFITLPTSLPRVASALGNVTVDGDVDYNAKKLDAIVDISTAIGTMNVDARAALPTAGSTASIIGDLNLDSFNAGALLDNPAVGLGCVSMTTSFDLAFAKPYPTGTLSAGISSIEFKGYEYSDISLDAKSENEMVRVSLDVNDPHADLCLDGHISTADVPSTQFYIVASNIDFSALKLSNSLTSHRLSFKADASLEGEDINSIDGWLRLNDISYINGNGKGVSLDLVDIESQCSDDPKRLSINSDVLEGSIRGSFNLSTVANTTRDIIGHFIPALTGAPDELASRHDANLDNDFTFDFTIKNNNNLERMFNLPITLVEPVKVKGTLSYPLYTLQLDVDAPYIGQGSKLIRGTSLGIDLDGLGNTSRLMVTSTIPTKRGDLIFTIDGAAVDNRINTQVDWLIENKADFTGDLNFTTTLSRVPDQDGNQILGTRININPGVAVFNDTIWEVAPSSIDILPGHIAVDDFKAYHDGQSISVDGVVANDTTSVLRLALRDIDLDYIFSTLNIPNVMFGGNATGDFYASGLLAGDPRIYTPLLQVNNLSYNGCVMGDGTIRSRWVGDDRAIMLDADIAQADSRHSRIKGKIRPVDEELDFYFDADHAQIGFLQPFMSAFCSDINGEASGSAHLYGTFKLIDMTGDLFADSIRMKLDFTNVYYTASDSVHIRPGRIEFEDIELSDPYGNKGLLSGYLTHECFKKPVFEFRVSNARNMLVYDVPETTEQRWYGHVFGNGNAVVKGRPGLVDINVDMKTAPKSSFTFVLSDAEVANDYTFITFRDRDRQKKDSILKANTYLATIEKFNRQVNARKNEIDVPSIYKMNISVDVTPEAAVNLIMDPVGGDAIKANGSGLMTMSYDSSNEDLKMRGTYTLTRGSYNFTLQDIIRKDFTIEPGSSITFNGDPYAAQLDITAAYSLNANLTDLDESFAQDKELNRTNVPVHAMLIARGDMRHPEISFDLSFPTLTQDTYRKVKSIVSTDEMMNTQIIYLLALNRFYTPDYMASTTKGNELVSVASSTISSQLSSILGNLSDNWSIAPNFRSDRGDFSDMEFDLALSSHLLNNRLLLNGNFGYRDKSLNNNSFIGDFDAEYLLNRAGTIRLKAYNRYNDQNFYVKNALTTQGLGVVFKRDFDNIFSFWRPIRRWFNRQHKENNDTITPATGDTIPQPQMTQ